MKNLRWYRSANRCRFYRSSIWIRNGLYVVTGFSWWRGRIIMREVTAGHKRYHYAKAGDFIEVHVRDFVRPGQIMIEF